MNYETKAINCVKDTALPIQMQWLKDCNRNLDTDCQKYGGQNFSLQKQSNRDIFMKWAIQDAYVKKR